MKISLILVGYFSSACISECLASFRRELGGTALDSEIIVVDHSEDRHEAGMLREIGADVLLCQSNGGYAAGLNAGVRKAGGEILFLANPDILFLEGSVSRLLAALDAGWTIAGPQLYWDRKGEILLPPPDDPSPARELHRRFRAAFPFYWKKSLDRELDRIHRLWSPEGPVEVSSLRGPLLVIRREDWEKFGPMDEGYFLYFEETEFLLRARRRGARLALVRDAGLVHEWGHSTRNSSEAAGREIRSRHRFYRRNFPLGGMVLKLFRPESVVPVRKRVFRDGGMESMKAGGGDLFLFSPFEHLHPAAGWVGEREWPPDAYRLFQGGEWRGLAASGGPGDWKVCGIWQWGGK